MEKINHNVTEALHRADVKEGLQKMALEPLIGTPADAARFFAEETAFWEKVIRENKLKVQ